MNHHLDEVTSSLINGRNVYSTFTNPHFPIRKAWKHSSFSGKVNSDKTLSELLQKMWTEAKRIYNTNLSSKVKFNQLKELALYSKESQMLKEHFQDVFYEIFNDISIFIDDTKEFKNEAISADTYKDIPTKGSFFTRAFYIFRRFLKTFNKYKSKNKTLQEDAKNGDLKMANTYIKRKYNTQLIKKLRNRFDDSNPVLLPIVGMPKYLNETKDFFIEMEGNPEKNLSQNLNLNVIPLALSQIIANETNWDIDFNINSDSIIKSSQSPTSKRQSSSIIDRFFTPGIYSGTPIENRNYIIVDDNITLGGSIKDLQEYIEQNDGKVVGVITLDRSVKTGFNPNIRPSKNQVEKIKEKRWYLEYCFTDILGYEDGVGVLTAQEMKALNNWIRYNPLKRNQIETICLESLSNLLIVNENYVEIMRDKIVPAIMKRNESIIT